MALFAASLESIEKSQLSFLYALKELRNPIFDSWNLFLNLFDTSYFVFLLIPVVWVFISRSWGIKLIYLLSFSNLVNETLKNIFQIPRPFTHDSSLGMLDLSSSYSLPSGAAQTAVILGFLIIWAKPKSPWAWILGINYFLWVSFSRMYLGVHYPLDILAGWCAGSIILIIFFNLFPKIGSFTSKHLRIVTLAQMAILLLLFYFFPDRKLLQFFSLSMGICLGLILGEKKTYFTTTLFKKWIKLGVCFLGIFLGYFFLTLSYFQSLINILPNIFMALWLTLFHEKLLKRWEV